MIPKPCRNLALIVPLLLILMQVGLACHSHSANSCHNEKDFFHSPCTYTVFDDSSHVIADIHTAFFHSPHILEGELVQVDPSNACPAIFVPLSRSRAPPA